MKKDLLSLLPSVSAGDKPLPTLVTCGDQERGLAMSWMYIKNRKEKYHAYLASREWAILKKQVRERAGGICERCHHNKIDEIHHDTYIRKYHERLEDLRGLCCPCHAFLSGELSEDPAYDSIPLERPPLDADGLPAIFSVKCAGCGATDCDFIGCTRPNVYCAPCSTKLDDQRREDVA